MKKEITLLGILLILFCTLANGQSVVNTGYSKIKNSTFKDAYDLTNSLPIKMLKNGSDKQNVAPYLQKALDENKIVVMPDFTVFVGDEGLKITSGHKILFQPNSKIQLLPSKKERYSILDIRSVKDVEVYYPSIIGDRNNHIGSSGQWGYGIYIGNSKNVLVVSPHISDTWGDGICIGGRGGIASQNISILGGVIKNTRRNGISLISGIDVIIDSVYIENANGQNPQSGIDIEPDSPNNELQNILVSNITTANNKLHGIVISIGNLAGKNKKNVSIKIRNHKDVGSFLGLGLLYSRNNQRQYENIVGNIDIENLNYSNNKIFLRNYTTFRTGIKTNMGTYNFTRDGKSIVFPEQKEKFLNTIQSKQRSIK